MSRDVHANDRKNICLLWRPSGGEGNRTPDLLNAIQALSQLSYAPGALGNAKLTFPSGTAKNSRGYIECQEIGASETYFGRYFARGGMTIWATCGRRHSDSLVHYARTRCATSVW